MKDTKAARFFDPIVAVKNDLRGLQSVHVSFQSMSSCKFASVNAPNLFNYARKVEAGINNSGILK